LWGVISVKRDVVDRAAIRKALQVLRAGECLLVAPEGTRGPALREAKEGAAYLASRSGAAIVPVAIEGTEGFPKFRFSEQWGRPGVRVRFGRPFRYKPEFRKARGRVLGKMMAEAMFVLASMLPPKRRGVYQDLSNATQDTIKWV
jgi:1-acyl-sn-glycerol-3-phosphate acyltransferase